MAIAHNPMDVASWGRGGTINNGGAIVQSYAGATPFAQVTLGPGYSGTDPTSFRNPILSTINTRYNNTITGCPPCS